MNKLNLGNFAVYDNVLNDKEFENLWLWVQTEKYTGSHSKEWLKVWRLSDNPPMGGPTYLASKAPFNNAIDILLPKILQIAQNSEAIIGKRGENWKEITIRSYIYPRGTKLSWHNDQGYKAACVFYTHPRWSVSWGGELFIADVDEEFENALPSKLCGPLDHDYRDRLIGERGIGRYVYCKPNRAVLTPAPIWHTVSRVDQDAGDYCRCSIVCFFR